MGQAPPPGRREGPAFRAEREAKGEDAAVRKFSEQGKYVRPVDAHDRAMALQALGWSPVGLIMGTGLGILGTSKYGWPGWLIVVTAMLGWALVYFGPQWIAAMGGRAGSTIYNPSGSSTPRDKEYSYEESLAVRGLFEEAATAFEIAINENPGDPKPYLRLARILRDELHRHEDAAKWLKRVQDETDLPSGMAFLVRKELVELYWHKMGQPAKAAPMLARLAEEAAGTADGEWAAKELAEVKAIIAQERELPG